MLKRSLSLALLLILLLPGLAMAQQARFISDELALDLRSGPGNQYRILQMVPAGTRVQVLDSDSGWTQVRLGTGMEGWVLSRLLTDQPSARSRLESAERALEEVREENRELSAELEEARTRLGVLEAGLREATDERDEMEQRLARASQGLEYYEDNQELRKQVIDLRREIEDLTHEAERLRGRNDQRWFLVGSAVLGGGILFGLIIPRIRWRRERSGWGSGGL